MKLVDFVNAEYFAIRESLQGEEWIREAPVFS